LVVYPLFRFFWLYLYRAGFLDGREGHLLAKNSAIYTFLKYYYYLRLKLNFKI